MLTPIFERIVSVPPFVGATSFDNLPDAAYRNRVGEEGNFAVPHTFKIENIHGEISISCFEWPLSTEGPGSEPNEQLELIIREIDGEWTAVSPEGVEFTEAQIDYAISIMDIFLRPQ